MKKILLFLPAILYYALIFLLSSMSFILEGQISIPFLDKGIHLVEFGLLGFFLSLGYFLSLKSSLRIKSSLTLASGIMLGCLDEIHQYFVPNRSFEVMDMVADSIGILIGLVAFYYFSRTNRGKALTQRLLKTG
jgi:VanZ family protein